MRVHTPGPWHDDGYRIYAPTESEDKCDGRMIVEYKHVDDFNYADASLLTAAPDLLDALRTAEAMLEGGVASECRFCGGEGGWTDDHPAAMTPVVHKDACEYFQISRAIAKAEGR